MNLPRKVLDRHATNWFGKRSLYSVLFLGCVFSILVIWKRNYQTAFAQGTPISAAEAAHAAIIDPQTAVELLPKDEAFLKETAAAHFAILYPEQANAERLGADPTAGEREQISAFTILNAKSLEIERRKDPLMRQEEERVLKSLIPE